MDEFTRNIIDGESERKEKEGNPDDTIKIGGSGMDIYLSPVSFWWPEYLNESAWIDHAPFAFWLMEILRPRTFVELGTHGGYSYFAFCQAVNALKLETRCYAVDTWVGDEHAGFYGEEVFERVQDYNERYYVAFSRLVRSTFDEALAHFSNGSIDLLHIDGRHFYEDIKHDFESWRPRLSKRSVVLFHDTNVRERNFGAFRLWEELQAEFPTFEFLHGHGLGVVGYGSDLPEGIKAFFEATVNSRVVTEVRSVYGHLGAALKADFGHQQGFAELDGQIVILNQAIAGRDGQIAEILSTTSWRVTQPLRWIGNQLRRVRMSVRFLPRALLFAPKRIDAEWYLMQNPDVAMSGMHPYKHYILHGKKEGRLPAPPHGNDRTSLEKQRVC